MESKIKTNAHAVDRNGERGAALLTVLLVSILLLSAGLALVMSTSLSTTTAIDATAEMQAYEGAEAGLEATLNVMRGNIAPDSSLVGTKITFKNAAKPSTSNKTSDAWATGTNATSRLSGWLNYSYASNANDWRVPITASYAPLTGIAYKVTITDPDDPGLIGVRKITTQASYKPSRLMIQSIGYGPKGAVKKLEMVVKVGSFDFQAPGAITMAGGSAITLALGNSANVSYSGVDHASPAQSQVAAIAVASGNVASAQTVINGLGGTQVSPNNAIALTANNTPSFLQSADAARAFLIQMRAFADSPGVNRLFATQAAADAAGGLGTVTSPKFTFIDNYGGAAVDLGANHQGSGMLIVTGNLDTHGNTDFEGIILVLGRGRMTRDGGGNGVLRGAVLIANFDPNGAPGSAFLNPTFTINGGGDSKVYYDSAWVRDALEASGFQVNGVREYH